MSRTGLEPDLQADGKWNPTMKAEDECPIWVIP